MAAHFPEREIGGVAVVTLVALLLVLLVCYGAGLLARAAFGRALSERFENRLHALYPRYTVIKAMTQGLGGGSGHDALSSVLVSFDDHQMLAFEVERSPEMNSGGNTDSGAEIKPTSHPEQVTLYLPGSPDPWSGTVINVTPDRVQTLDTPFPDLLGAFEKLRLDSQKILRGESVH